MLAFMPIDFVFAWTCVIEIKSWQRLLLPQLIKQARTTDCLVTSMQPRSRAIVYGEWYQKTEYVRMCMFVPDMLEVGPPGNAKLTLAEQRAHFALWALIKSPLLIGADLRSAPCSACHLPCDETMGGALRSMQEGLALVWPESAVQGPVKAMHAKGHQRCHRPTVLETCNILRAPLALVTAFSCNLVSF